MVVYELIKWALGGLVSLVGIEGVAIGALSLTVVGLWYLREFASVLQLVARYSRTLSVVLLIVLLAVVAGSVTGALEVEASIFGQLSEVLTK